MAFRFGTKFLTPSRCPTLQCAASVVPWSTNSKSQAKKLLWGRYCQSKSTSAAFHLFGSPFHYRSFSTEVPKTDVEVGIGNFRSIDAEIKESLRTVKSKLDDRGTGERLKELDLALNQPDLWDDPKKAGKISREHAQLGDQLRLFDEIEQGCDAAIELALLAIEENNQAETPDPDNIQVLRECYEELQILSSKAQRFSLEMLLDGPADKMGCLIEISAGAGGTESCEFSLMLMNMYKNFATASGYSATVVETVPGQEAGIRNGVLRVQGDNVYGWMRTETGVHRLVRISPYDTQHRRQTCFAQVAVSPFAEEDDDETLDVEINPSEIEIDTYRSSGPGGQHANTTDSAVRIKHIPTGIVCTSQSQRSQHQNKAYAMMVLKSKLMELKIREKAEEKQAFRDTLGETTWGNQIRSYVLNPYQMVKDHRTNHETPQADRVLGGEPEYLSPFMQASLLKGM